MNSNESRLSVIDALRGFAIVSIMLLHNLEHFDFYYKPNGFPAWLVSLDKGIWDSLFFLFAGKSYAIFSLLFGLTFFIQSRNQEKIGKDFRGRFAWRLVLLFAFGVVNSAFYQGDILTFYAIIGFFLIPFAKLSNRVVFWIAIILMLQPYEWVNFITGLQNPGVDLADPISWAYFGKMEEYITGNSLINLWIGNLTNGKLAVYNWFWENGRVFQTLSLFLFGMLAGRKSLFRNSAESKRFWVNTLTIASVSFIILFIIKINLGDWISSKAILRPLEVIESSWTNMAFMLILVSGFTLLFQSRSFHRILNTFSALGQMSLSNYVMQSIMGSFIYYEFGLGLYKYTGATLCLLIGVALAVIQGYFSFWWMKNNKHGPLETLWHKATWIGTEKMIYNKNKES